MCLPRVWGKAAFKIIGHLEKVPRRAGVARIVLADRSIDVRRHIAQRVLFAGRKLSDGQLVAAATFCSLLFKRAGVQRSSGLGFHFHRL
jgi:hypothetical protein